MRFNCTRKTDHLEKWHQWFAWHPVRLPSGDCVWLETVLRKIEFVGGYDGIYPIPSYKELPYD